VKCVHYYCKSNILSFILRANCINKVKATVFLMTRQLSGSQHFGLNKNNIIVYHTRVQPTGTPL